MAGGATMFSLSSNSPIATIGKRNVESCRETLLACLGIELVAERHRRQFRRTIYFDIETGSLRIALSINQKKLFNYNMLTNILGGFIKWRG